MIIVKVILSKNFFQQREKYKKCLLISPTASGKSLIIYLIVRALGVKTLIIVPTRELAIQIEQEIQGLSYFISIGSKAIYGGGSGKDWSEQKEALVKGTDVIVATPGKLLSHLILGYVECSYINCLVLDEADRMLNMGFIDDLYKIISYIPAASLRPPRL